MDDGRRSRIVEEILSLICNMHANGTKHFSSPPRIERSGRGKFVGFHDTNGKISLGGVVFFVLIES
jgi:hypothetical protein